MDQTALIIPGGGMRNAYTSGVLIGLDVHARQFDAIFAFSSAAPVAAYFLAGQMDEAEHVWTNELTRPEIVDWKRALNRQRPVDVHTIVDVACRTLNYDAFDKHRTKLIVSTFRVDDGQTIYHRVKKENARMLLKATCALPLFADPIEIQGARHMDGGIEHILPVRTAYEQGYRRLLIIGNRPAENTIQALARALMSAVYPEAPALQRALHKSRTNTLLELEFISHPPRDAEIIYLGPTTELDVSRFCRNKDKIRQTFHLGTTIGATHQERIHAFLNAAPTHPHS